MLATLILLSSNLFFQKLYIVIFLMPLAKKPLHIQVQQKLQMIKYIFM